MVGVVPAIYGWAGEQVGLQTYFAMARGAQDGDVAKMRAGHVHDGKVRPPPK